MLELSEEPAKKRRGRKKKVDEPIVAQEEPVDENNITVVIEEIEDASSSKTEAVVAKKRGRKPKGGKLIMKQQDASSAPPQIANVILHLKCSMHDLTEHNEKISQLVTDPMVYNPVIPPNIMTYNIDDNNGFSIYEAESLDLLAEKDKLNATTDFAYAETHSKAQPAPAQYICSECNSKKDDNQCTEQCIDEFENENEDDTGLQIKDIYMKLKKLKLQLYKNSNLDKKAACFWCTYDYDNPPCYIPKYEMDGQLCGYGSFCRPECAVAYLMKENIDDSTKFERYHLLNQMYSKIYNYKKNIKPAPNPYFLLEKYYGNLSIQEYRKLFKTEHMLMVIEKPMTRILPELHEDNDDFLLNIYGGKSAQTNSNARVYKVKRQSEKQKGPSKNAIMKENFGF